MRPTTAGGSRRRMDPAAAGAARSSTLLGPLARDLVCLAVFDRPQSLLAGIAALSPGVDDPVAAAVRADLGDDDATTVAAHAALVPLVRSALRALGLVGRQLDGVSLAVERERHDLAILIERIGATPCPHVDPVRACALAPIAT